MLRRIVSVAAVLLIAGAVWWSEKITAIPASRGPVEVTYWEKWTSFEGDAMRAVVGAFNRKQKRIHVKLLTVSGIEDKTLMATAGGNPPDVAGLYGPNIPQYAEDNAVIPLDDYCRKYGIKAEDYIPVYWDNGLYKGHVYGLCSTPETTALHYNKRMLRDAGLDPNKPPTTIEEMDVISDKLFLRGKDGKLIRAGFMPAEPGWWNWGWGCVFGGKFWDGKSKITANSPEMVRGYEWVRSYSKKYGADDLQTFRSGFGNFSSPQNAFLSEKVAMELQGVWMHNFITMFAPKLEWAAAPFPHPADRPDMANTTYTSEDVLVIPRGAKHPNEAFEFIAYVQSQEGMEMLCMGHRKQSPLRKVSRRFWETHPNPYIKLFTDLAWSKNAIVAARTPLWPEYNAELGNAFDEVALLKATPQAALDKVQARMQPKLDRLLAVQRARGEEQ